MIAVFSTSCGTITVPISGTTSTGETYKGAATASVNFGKFEMTGSSGTICSGSYDQFATAKRLTVPFTCTNGISGSVDLNRDNDLMGGDGSATFSDGTTAKIIYGKDRVKG